MKRAAAKNAPEPFCVVGIGASAGGLDAINQFMDNVPLNSGFAYVIIQHLSPDHKSLMADLLTSHTQMKVIEADDEMVIEKNCVYLLPSRKTLTVKDGKLLLHPKMKTALPNNNIDVFFESLANEYESRAIGIILSGTGTDGTRGVKAISEKGGVVIVQDPSTSAFNGMPVSAIASGACNLILAPHNMAHELIEYVQQPASARSIRFSGGSDEFYLHEITDLVRKVTGHDFNYYKSPTLIRKLSKKMSELKISDMNEYLGYLNSNPDQVKSIAQDFLINVTQFFRDTEAFDTIREKIIPSIFENKTAKDTIKVWSVACSSGEEAYSLAILFHEYMEKNNRLECTVKIFATDIDQETLEIGSKGIYPRSIIESVSGQRIAKYFDPEGEGYKIKADIRKMVVFSQHNILKDPPFGRIDLVTCRNMLIYINSSAQKEVLKKLHFAMNLNGYLFVGPSEHIEIIKPSLEEIDKKWKIFKCISKARAYEGVFYHFDKGTPAAADVKLRNPLLHLGEIFKETLLEETGYAGIYIDLNFDVKQAIGDYKKYLAFPEVSFNFNLLKLLHPDLSVVLSSALRKAVQENKPVTLREVKVHDADKNRLVSIIIKPYIHSNHFSQQFIFVVLKEVEKREIPAPSQPEKVADMTDIARIEELEYELRETKESLQAVIEEMEATNEELQSANEEMLSNNEELQSANEELQSLNEELHTVSAEHQAKIRELIELNDDLNNYFRNSEIGQILVDKNFIVRKFSPSVTRMVNLIPSDIHRSILDITTRFRGIDFIGDIGLVIRNGIPAEKEIIIDDNIYLLRISPYERHDKRIDGAVINFVDITKAKQLDSLLDAIFQSVPSAIVATKSIRNNQKEINDFEFIAVNPSGEKNLGLNRKDVIGKRLKAVFPLSYKDMIKTYREVAEDGKSQSYDFFNENINKWTNVVLVKFLDGVISVATDITEKKKAADLVERNYEELRKSLRLNKKRN
jgi:two-component system CheB/CheR fusion protein